MLITTLYPVAHLHLSEGELLLILGGILIGGSGLLLFCYCPYYLAVNALARGPLMGKPVALFICALLGGSAWVGFCYWGTSVLYGADETIKSFLLTIAGIIGWFSLLACYMAERRYRKAAGAAQSQTAPVFQVWFQDLVVALLCYSAGLSIFACWGGSDYAKSADLLPHAVYTLLAGSLGLLIAADVARRSKTFQRPVPRLVFFVIVFAVFPVALPVALIAWWRWRRALEKTGASSASGHSAR